MNSSEQSQIKKSKKNNKKSRNKKNTSESANQSKNLLSDEKNEPLQPISPANEIPQPTNENLNESLLSASTSSLPCTTKKKVNSVVVSVKKFVENSEVDEVTKLFRTMIGIDKPNEGATIVRQYSCRNCYRAWWRRVRVSKQVSICSRCKLKYEPIPLEKEFGVAEFKCPCSNQFFQWCSKDGFSVCKRCNNMCQPVKILINARQTNQANNQNLVENKKNNYGGGSGSCSTSSCCSSSSGSARNESDESKSDANSAKNSYFSNRRSVRSSKFTRGYFKYPSGGYFCEQCHDTYVNLNACIVFRPTKNAYQEFLPTYQNANGISFCTHCRQIPVFSDDHISTGSTLASLSYQGDLELRFLDDEIECLEPCDEEQSEENTNQTEIYS